MSVLRPYMYAIMLKLGKTQKDRKETMETVTEADSKALKSFTEI